MPQSLLRCRTRPAPGIIGTDVLSFQPRPTALRTGLPSACTGLRPQRSIWTWSTLVFVLVFATALGLGWSDRGVAHPHPIALFVAGAAPSRAGYAARPGATAATPVATSVPTLAPTSAPATPVAPNRPAPAPRSVAFPYWFLVLVVLALVALVAIAATSAASRGPRERSGPPYPTA